MSFDPDLMEVTYHWSRMPGEFVNKRTGETVQVQSVLNYEGSVREWYETLVETVRDVGITLAGDFTDMDVFVSPRTQVMLEASVLYRPAFEFDGAWVPEGVTPGSIGKLGEMSVLPLVDDEESLEILVRVGEEGSAKFGRVIVKDIDLGV